MTTINPQAVRGPVTAVPVVAGTGVRFVEDAQNNRVVAEIDETELWSGTRTHSIITSESIHNFKYIDVYQSMAGTMQCAAQRIETSNISSEFRIGCSYPYNDTTMYYFGSIWTVASDGKTLTATNKGCGYSVNLTNGSMSTYTNNSNNGGIMKIVGISRIASN